MSQENLTALGTSLLRVALGTMFLVHSLYYKLVVFTMAGTVGYFESIGLPGVLAYVVFTAEAIGGAMLVLGVQARWAALALLPILGGVIYAHTFDGKLEYPIYLFVLAVAQVLLGDGKFALVKSWPPERFLRGIAGK